MKFKSQVLMKLGDIYQALLFRIRGGPLLIKAFKELHIENGDVIICIVPDSLLGEDKNLASIDSLLRRVFEHFDCRNQFAVLLINETDKPMIGELFEKVSPELIENAGWVRKCQAP